MDLLYSTTLYQFDPTEISYKRTWDKCSYTCSGQRKSLASLASIVNSTFFLLMGFSSPAPFIPQDKQWLYFLTPQRFSLAIFRFMFGIARTSLFTMKQSRCRAAWDRSSIVSPWRTLRCLRVLSPSHRQAVH
ncbi:unnamed protein product [Peronospora effusa]|nr:unnamed protein product [Peronospora effusa]